MLATNTFQAADSLSERIAQHVGRQIIIGELKARERVQELKICSDLGVSRGPVREALLILERRHLVDILPRKGAMVSSLSVHQVNALYDFYISLLKMLVTSLADKWENIATLQPLLSKIASMLQVDDTDTDAIEDFLEDSFELMRAAARIVDNPYLQESLENLQPAIHRTYYLSMQIRNDGIATGKKFFEEMAQGVTKVDHELLVKSVHEFAENQRKMVLEAVQ